MAATNGIEGPHGHSAPFGVYTTSCLSDALGSPPHQHLKELLATSHKFTQPSHFVIKSHICLTNLSGFLPKPYMDLTLDRILL